MARSETDLNEPTQLSTQLGRIGKYSLITLLGEGGVARVYLARREGSAGLCALKVLRPEHQGDAGVVGRFRREAEIGLALDHPGATRVLASHVDESPPHLALELIAGLDLEQLSVLLRYKERLLPYPLSTTVVTKALEVLEAAHRLNIIHRDLSPKNIMLSFDGRPKLIDFGAAKATLGEFRTTPGSEMGTLQYLAPEIARGETPGPACDVYGVGAIAYHLLAGVPVIEERATPLLTLRAIVEEPLRPIRELNPDVPLPLARVVERALEKQLEHRYRSAAAFRAAIEQAAPDWCKVTEPQLESFLGAWFPEQAESFRRLRAGAEPAVEEQLTTVLFVPSKAKTDPTLVWLPERIEEKSGLSFPQVRVDVTPRGGGRAILLGAGAVMAALLLALFFRPASEVIVVGAPDEAAAVRPPVVTSPAAAPPAPSPAALPAVIASPAPSPAALRAAPTSKPPSSVAPSPKRDDARTRPVKPAAPSAVPTAPPSRWSAVLSRIDRFAERPDPAEHERLVAWIRQLVAQSPSDQRAQLSPALERVELDGSAESLRALARLGFALEARAQ